jgi:hypothetical protein
VVDFVCGVSAMNWRRLFEYATVQVLVILVLLILLAFAVVWAGLDQWGVE